jgi:hypothetical protein
MSTQGYIPPELSEADLKRLLLQALDDAPGWKSNETFHARFDHLERGITMDDVIHGIERAWSLNGSQNLTKISGSGNIIWRRKPLKASRLR